MHPHLISQPALISVYCQLSAAFASNKTIRKDISGRADIHDIKHSANNKFFLPTYFCFGPRKYFSLYLQGTGANKVNIRKIQKLIKTMDLSLLYQ